jgi:hypothetical protein
MMIGRLTVDETGGLRGKTTGSAVSQVVARAAVTMIFATASGRVTRDRWPALTVEICAPVWLDMACCRAGGIAWSAVPISDHDGIVLHAGGPEGSKSLFRAAGR